MMRVHGDRKFVSPPCGHFEKVEPQASQDARRHTHPWPFDITTRVTSQRGGGEGNETPPPPFSPLCPPPQDPLLFMPSIQSAESHALKAFDRQPSHVGLYFNKTARTSSWTDGRSTDQSAGSASPPEPISTLQNNTWCYTVSM
jgi:hypothetical protein